MFLIVAESIERVFMKRPVGFATMRGGIPSHVMVGTIAIALPTPPR